MPCIYEARQFAKGVPAGSRAHRLVILWSRSTACFQRDGDSPYAFLKASERWKPELNPARAATASSVSSQEASSRRARQAQVENVLPRREARLCAERPPKVRAPDTQARGEGLDVDRFRVVAREVFLPAAHGEPELGLRRAPGSGPRTHRQW